MTRTWLAVAALGVITACATDGVDGPENKSGLTGAGDGMTRVYLTDAPFPFDVVESVNIYIASIAASETADTLDDGGQDWVTLATPERRFDLLEVQRGATALLGEGDLPAGVYRALRVVIDTDSSSIVYTDGSLATVRWPVEGPLALHAIVEAPLDVPEDGADIVIDFDVGRSFLGDYCFGADTLPGARCPDFVFISFIRAVNEAATGTIAGQVWGQRGTADVLETVPGAAVIVLRGDSTLPENTWWVSATAWTDAQGNYEVHYLLEGTYMVQVAPPAGWAADNAILMGVEVRPGETTTLDVTLEPAQGGLPGLVIDGSSFIALGDSTILVATEYDGSGNAVQNAGIEWTSSDAAIAYVDGVYTDIEGRSSLAVIRAGALGQTTITASSASGQENSILVTVFEDTTNAGPAVIITGNSYLVVGNSGEVRAIVLDAEGNDDPDAPVTWSVDPAGIVRLEPAGQTATVFAEAEGNATVFAASGDLLDSLVITVVADTGGGGGGGGGAVATVEVSPASQTIQVGDSTGVMAILRDNTGARLSGRQVSWTVSDPAIVRITAAAADWALLDGLSPGTVTVTAISEGKSGTGTVTVTQ